MLNRYQNLRETRPWALEIAAAVLCLVAGAALMPALIFAAGAATLGKYDGASAGRIYGAVFQGLGQSSAAAWCVLLGPFLLYLLFRILRIWWRLGAA
jgi:hypothetical protein